VRRFFLAVFVSLTLVPLAHGEVSLSPAQTDNLGLRTQRAEAAQAPFAEAAVARVIDPLPWIRLENDWIAAQAAVQAASAEATRTRALNAAGSGVSSHVMETAQAAFAAEQAKLRSVAAERRLTLGAAAQALDAKAWSVLIDDLAQGRAHLLRIEPVAPMGAVHFDAAALRGAVDSIAVQWLGPAAQSTGSAGPAYIGVVHTGALAVGAVLDASLSDSTRSVSGQRIPDAAVLRWTGRDWVYVATDAHTFERHAVTLLRRLDDGNWLVDGVEADDAVVIVGAATLLTAELGQGAAEEP
jgi:hypothetical protein